VSHLDDEFQHHIQLTTRHLIAEGMVPETAAREAHRRFGSLAYYRRVCQRIGVTRSERTRRGNMFEMIWQDVRFTLRTFRRYPTFLLATAITLAVGIGASTAIFSVVDTVVLRPLPYSESDRLVQVGTIYPGGDRVSSSSPMNFFDWRDRSNMFDYLVGSRIQSMILAGDAGPEMFRAAGVSHDYFELLGWSPFIGRDILAADDNPAGNRVVVLSHGFWQRRFGADQSIVGRTLRLRGNEYEIVGVMPASFTAPEAIYHEDVEMWFPLAFVSDDLTQRDNGFLQVIGRLKDGVGIEQARSAVTTLQRSIYGEVGTDNARLAEFRDRQSVGIEWLHARTVGEARGNLLVFLGAVGFLLLIACANVANLLLVRSTDRQRELALRTALGADRGRIIHQLLTEGVITALIGGLVGAGFAVMGVRVFRAWAPEGIPRVAEVAVDLRVLVFTVLVSIATGLFFGLVPAISNGRLGVAESLKEGTTSATAGRHRSLIRSTLVVSETAVALVLMVGAGLLLNSFVRRATADPGFDPRNVVRLALFLEGYETGEDRAAFFDELVRRANAVPGVEVASATNNLPMTRNSTGTSITVDGRPRRGTDPLSVDMHAVTGGFFETLRIPLRQGRMFVPGDGQGEQVVIVNQAMADLYWDGQAVGGRFKFDDADSPGPWMTVVGVVETVHQFGLGDESGPALYRPHERRPFAFGNLIARTSVDIGGTASALREAVWSIDPGLAVEESGPLTDLMRNTITEPRFYTWLLTTFAGVATVLAAVGIYGTVSFSVARRTHEIGIRMALGAAGREVQRLILKQGITLAALGVAIGLGGALVLSRVLTQFVFDIGTMDLPTYGATAFVLTAVAALACWLPARRATHVSPMQTLRDE
jgi:putative ABC transport system permease protein